MNPAVQRAAAMALRGLSIGEIAQAMRIKPNSVTNYLTCARRAGLAVPKCKPGPTPKSGLSTLRISTDLVSRLRPHAVARHLNISELASQLLSEIAADGLVDAILDDGEVPDA